MAFKINLFVVAAAVLAQIAYGQVLPCAGNSYVENNVIVNGASGLASEVNVAGANLAGVTNLATNIANAANFVTNVGVGSLSTAPGYLTLSSLSGGGVLPVTSYSPIAVSGLQVVSDNAIEGSLSVIGELPFLSAVALEGALNTDGAGEASCGCGSGAIGITSENYGNTNGLGLGLNGVRSFGGNRF